MPGAIRTCFLCGQSKRDSQSMYMTIDCFEQERRIRDAYLKRVRREIIGTLIGREMHRQYYRSILQRQSPARVRSKSYPRKYCSRAKRNKLQPKSNSMVVIDPDMRFVNADGPLTNISSDSSAAVNNDEENRSTQIEDNADMKRLENEPSIDFSKPFRDLTNVHLVPIVVDVSADQPSSNISIDANDRYFRTVSEQSMITFNSNSSIENIVIDHEPDETSFNSEFYSSNIP